MLVPFKSRQVSPREKREGDDDDGGGRKSEAEKGSLGEDPSARVFTVSDDDESLVRWSPQVDLSMHRILLRSTSVGAPRPRCRRWCRITTTPPRPAQGVEARPAFHARPLRGVFSFIPASHRSAPRRCAHVMILVDYHVVRRMNGAGF